MKAILIFIYVLMMLLFLSMHACQAATWECISRIMTCHTWRMAVPEGWLVSGDNGNDAHYAMTFVPDKEHVWKG